jgi:hypothetical protein
MLGASLQPVTGVVAGWMEKLPDGVATLVGGFQPGR